LFAIRAKSLLHLFSLYTLYTYTKELCMQGPDTPKGTIALLLVYALLIIFLWGNAYLTMLSRGVTQ